MPPLSGIKVVRSKVHGYGVVALRDYAPGETIADVEGIPLRLAEVGYDEYCLYVHEDMYFDMVDQTRWINHSCEPNTEVDCDEETDGRVWAKVKALKPIKTGEELFYDYAFALEHAVPCHCGVKSCRGYIIDPDLRDELMSKLAEKKFSPPATSNTAGSQGSASSQS